VGYHLATNLFNSWYSFRHHIFLLQTRFDAPEGKSPVAVRMTGMKKGMIWINGKSIGRYWMNYVSPLGEPTQSE
jgi:hypothetical protein